MMYYNELLWSILLSLNFFIAVFARVECPIKCKTEVSNFVSDYCQKNNGTMDGKCCRNQNKTTIIGLDLQNCNITTFNVTEIKRADVEIIDLVENDIEPVTIAEFLGYSNLNYLFLPDNRDCPGGPAAWNCTSNVTECIDSNQSHDENVTVCSVQLNPCRYLNVSCTVFGQCLHLGPGSAKCDCIPGNYGYKCLQQGNFPSTVVAVVLACGTIFLSAFLWYTLRRHVIVPRKRD